MRVRIVTGLLGLACVDAGVFFIYRPLSLIFLGASLLFIAARGGKRA